MTRIHFYQTNNVRHIPVWSWKCQNFLSGPLQKIKYDKNCHHWPNFDDLPALVHQNQAVFCLILHLIVWLGGMKFIWTLTEPKKSVFMGI